MLNWALSGTGRTMKVTQGPEMVGCWVLYSGSNSVGKYGP